MRTSPRRPVRLLIGCLAASLTFTTSPGATAAAAEAGRPVASTAAPAAAMVASLAAASVTPRAALDAAVKQASARGVHTAAVIADRSTGAILASVNPDEQIASASLVKLYTAVYYGIRNPVLKPSLADMIRVSRDSTQSSLWSTAIVPWVAARYGLTRSVNSAASVSGWWGTVKVTARDLVRFQYRMERDRAVNTFLPQAMKQATDTGSDGFDQNFGVNALAGTGSKQGWTSIVNYPSSNVYGLHSVGFTGKYYIAILQTASRGVGYQPMRTTVTHTAAVLAASVVPPKTPYRIIPRQSAQLFVATLYRQLLGRSGTSARFVDLLARGQWSTAMVAQAVAGSAEQYGALADRLMRSCLGHGGGAGYGYRLSRITLATGLQEICAGPEAWRHAGMDADQYLARVLSVVWRQKPTGPDLRRFRTILQKWGRASVITNATLDPRFKAQWIRSIYPQLLSRPATAAALTQFPKANVRFHGIEMIYVSVATSNEYWNKWARR